MANNLEVVSDEFISELTRIINFHGLDSKLGVADYLLTANLVTHIEQQYTLIRQSSLHAEYSTGDLNGDAHKKVV